MPDPTNPLSYGTPYEDPNNPLSQLDVVNRVALGPLYVPRENALAMPGAAGAGTGGRAPPAEATPETWYHGTSTKFDTFNTPEVYLTNDAGQAQQYAQQVHLGGTSSGGSPVVLSVNAKPGKTLNIDDHLFDAMDAGDDVGDALEDIIANNRNAGKVRYLEYTHPNAGDQGEHTVRVSLYPKDDLTIGK